MPDRLDHPSRGVHGLILSPEIMATMADTITQLADLSGLTLAQIAALSTTHEVLARILPDGTVQVPTAAFASSI